MITVMAIRLIHQDNDGDGNSNNDNCKDLSAMTNRLISVMLADMLL